LPGPRAALHFRLSTRDSHQTESKQRHALQRLSERGGITFAGTFFDHERGRKSFSRSDFNERIEGAERVIPT
jgi:DNA invertase Pin-like site-specific DNA recombinase